MTNNPERLKLFSGLGFETERFPIEKPYDVYDAEELGVKKVVLGHMLDLNGFEEEHISIYDLDHRNVFQGSEAGDSSRG
jgi:hypothetical protein